MAQDAGGAMTFSTGRTSISRKWVCQDKRCAQARRRDSFHYSIRLSG